MSFTVPTTDGRCNEKRENGKDMQDDVRIASIFSLGKENEFFIHCNFFGGKGFKLLESVTKSDHGHVAPGLSLFLSLAL